MSRFRGNDHRFSDFAICAISRVSITARIRRFRLAALAFFSGAVWPVLLFLAGLLGILQPAPAQDGRFVIPLTRALVRTGDEVMIGGFIIEGGARQVLIQALGPELAKSPYCCLGLCFSFAQGWPGLRMVGI